MITVTHKLKRCPFCGGIPGTRRLTKGIFKKRNYFYIVCLTCGATTRVQNTEEEVCVLWNNRACIVHPVTDGKSTTAQIIEGATE